MTFDPLLAIMHPRDIPDAVAAFRAKLRPLIEAVRERSGGRK